MEKVKWECFGCGDQPCVLEVLAADGRPTKCPYGIANIEGIYCMFSEKEAPCDNSK